MALRHSSGTDAPNPAATTQADFAPGPNIDTNAPGYTGSQPTGSRLSTFLNTLGAGGALGAEIDKYIESLKSFLPKAGDGSTAACGPVRVVRLTVPTGAHAVIVGEMAFILLFDALLNKDVTKFIPSSVHGSEASAALTRETGIKHPLNIILVQPEDYPRVQQMAYHLFTHLAIATNPAFSTQNVELLSENEFFVDPNPDTYRAFIDQRSPHAVQDRADIGFTIMARMGRSGPGFAENYRPIAACTAYTEILRSSGGTLYSAQGQPQFVPYVHITNITADVAVPGIIPMVLAIAAGRFVREQRWLQPYMTFQKTKPNLGNLLPDPTNKDRLGFISSKEELGRWLQQYMAPTALLVVDVAEGRARIPSLAIYNSPSDYAGHVYNQIASFFGEGLQLNRQMPAYYNMAQTFLGTVGGAARGGMLLDSRYVDLLDLLADGGGGVSPNAQNLMFYTQDPTHRAQLISELTAGQFKSLYWTVYSILNPNLLETIAQAVSQRVRIVGQDAQNFTNTMPYMNDLMQGYINNAFATTSVRPSTGMGLRPTIYSV